MLRGAFLSFTKTTSLMDRFLRGHDHFCHSCKLRRNSFRQRDQNSMAKCCTGLQHLREYTSVGSELPGGASSTLDFMVNRWLGVIGARESGSASWLMVRGWLSMIDSTLHINVRKDLSLSWPPLLARRDNRTELTVLICLSHGYG